MFYTYKINMEGGGKTRYLVFNFDRPLSGKSLYRDWSHKYHDVPPREAKIMESVSNVRGVIKGPRDTSNASELINLDGDSLTVHVALCDVKEAARMADNIVKRVQRIIAPTESRKRIKMDALTKAVAKLNARTYGT